MKEKVNNQVLFDKVGLLLLLATHAGEVKYLGN